MLDYNLAEKGELSLYEYLYRRIRDDIVADVLEADDRLPSKRSLAQHLGVSLVTVEGAYAQLVAEGYVRSRPRSGYFVNALPGLPARAALVRKASAAQHPEALALAEAAPAASGESRELARLWSRALRDALAGEPESELFSPAPPQGLPRLRAAISDHLRQTRGMQVDPSRIVVGAGAQVLDNMIVQLLGHDLTYGVEDPGYLRLTRLYRASGAQVAHIGLDDEGVRMDELAASRPDVMHLMPSHQFPTGRVTSIARRYELLGWACAEAGSRWIIEDDYDCEFRLAGRPVPALASIDATGSVIYTNTFSKGLGAALRLAYMVLPGQLMERYGTELGFYSTTVSSVQQVALARLLESGAYERHVARMRKRYRELRDEFADVLAESGLADRVRMEEADSGLHFVLAVEAPLSEEELVVRVAGPGLSPMPLSSCACLPKNRTAPDGLARLVVQYGSLDSEAISAFGAELSRALA